MQEEKYKTVAVEKLGEGVAYIFSPEKNYVLCKKEIKGTAQMPQNKIDYIVYDLKNSKIAHESSVFNGKIEWFSDFELEIFKIPGIMREGQDNEDLKWILNVKDGTEVRKKQRGQKD